MAFNALPATITADWHAHQYDQQANEVMCTLAKRNWTANGDEELVLVPYGSARLRIAEFLVL